MLAGGALDSREVDRLTMLQDLMGRRVLTAPLRLQDHRVPVGVKDVVVRRPRLHTLVKQTRRMIREECSARTHCRIAPDRRQYGHKQLNPQTTAVPSLPAIANRFESGTQCAIGPLSCTPNWAPMTLLNDWKADITSSPSNLMEKKSSIDCPALCLM